MNRLLGRFAVVVLVGIGSQARGDSYVWTGGAGTPAWSDPLNWLSATTGQSIAAPGPADLATFLSPALVQVGEAASITNGATLTIGPGRVGVNNGVIVNAGLITFAGDASTTSDEILVIDDTVTLTGPGTLQLVPGGDSFIWGRNSQGDSPIGIRDVLTNSAQHTIRGSGQIGVDLVNHGEVIADVANATLRLFGTSDFRQFLGSKNLGTLRAINDGRLEFSGINLDNRDGVIAVAGGSTLQTVGNVEVFGGQLQGGVDSNAILAGPSLFLRDVSFSNRWSISTGFSMGLLGTITNEGSISTPIGGQPLRVYDTVTLQGPGELLLSGQIVSGNTGSTFPLDVLIN